MPLPRDPVPDASIAFLRDGYRFIGKRCDELGANGFHTRIGLRKATCVRGRDAAEMFYSPGRFTRRGAVPPTTVTLLQDHGSVQAMDEPAHHARKETWMRMVAEPGSIERLVGCFEKRWSDWATSFDGEVGLHGKLREILTLAALDWCFIDIPNHEEEKRKEEFGAMIDGAGSFGFDQVKGQVLRKQSEKWARSVMRKALESPILYPEGSAPRILTDHEDPDGAKLTVEEAGVELLNCLRPVVAVARFMVFAALDLHRHPEWRGRLSEDPSLVHPLVLEVRRLAPFFPAIGGVVREPFTYAGEEFGEGDWVLLDLYGTNRDPSVYDDPDSFRPERFAGHEPGAYDLVAQGGGPFETTHRCPGERATVALVEAAVRALVALEYEVPDQDLYVDLSRFPALPASGFRIAKR